MKQVPNRRYGRSPVWKSAAASLVLVLLGACATTENPDPLEKMNRKVFAFNETVDKAVIKPVATGWQAVTPEMLRTGLDHFIQNISDVWCAFNLLLQGHPGLSMQELTRVGVNTVFGLGGLLDPASEIGLNRQSQDLGLTLAHWGVPSGAYIVWPIIGPSTIRDSVDLPVVIEYPDRLLEDSAARNIFSAIRFVNTRALYLEATDTIDEIALDKYLFMRDGYLQRRQSLVEQGHEAAANQKDGWWQWPQGGMAVAAEDANATALATLDARDRAAGRAGLASHAHAGSGSALPAGWLSAAGTVSTAPAPMQLSAEEYRALGVTN